MPQLTIAAPGGRKVEIECEDSATFGDVKARVQAALGVPVDKQRLLCSGKERKNASETLAQAGVGAKTKMMLMLAPGYKMPDPPAGEAADAAAAAPAAAAPSPQAAEDAEPINAEGELPLNGKAPAAEAATVHVKQGKNRYHVRVPQGLAEASFGDLADYIASSLIPGGVDPSELRFLSKGKTAAREDAIAAAGGKETTVMLLFFQNFHVAADGAIWLKDQSVELAEAEAEVEKLKKQVEANFVDVETTFRLAEVSGLLETLMQSVESVRVRKIQLPDMEKFRERVQAAQATLQEVRKNVRL
eukprot:TRINITY_DN83609_c0_g1_i1.p1 TRINITY_DN83609_c0_g1~~TRINITY_DN83609_c0_g1_i1.p1  ORF type:complete len:302 (+),score=102.77 TRINITY_DN83609_c0_g1_i1:253-1158(+)